MSLPALRLLYMRTWPCVPAISRGLSDLLLGRVLVLPAMLSSGELQDLVDMLALLLDLPVFTERPVLATGLYVLPMEQRQEPEGVPGSVLVCTLAEEPGRLHLDLPQAVMTLRDALSECIGRHWSGRRLQRLASWLSVVADTPGTAIHFADGVLAAHARDQGLDDSALFAAGLGGCLSWMLEGVDQRVAQWLIALATRSPEAGRLVDTESALLGADAALRRGFERGLLESLPERAGDTPDFRRALALLGELGEAPVQTTLAQVAAHLPSGLRIVLERATPVRPRPLGLDAPLLPPSFVGRRELLRRLALLLEPADEVRTVALVGPAGIGKSALAAKFAQQMVGRYETVWMSFLDGGEVAWSRVATALGLQVAAADRAWLHQAMERIGRGRYLLVVDHADAVSEEDLLGLLPAGPGAAAVLVLSQRQQNLLQREHGAIVLTVPPLDQTETRALIAALAPEATDAIRRSEVLDEIGGNPTALSLAAGLIARGGEQALQQIGQSVRSAAQGAPDLRPFVRALMDGYPESWRDLLRALAVCAPGGTLPVLPLSMAGIKEDDGASILSELADRALVSRGERTVHMHEAIRQVVDAAYLGEGPSRREEELRHAHTVAKLFRPPHQDDLNQDLLLALRRMTDRCLHGDAECAPVAQRLAGLAVDYRRGDVALHLLEAIGALRAVLQVRPRETAPIEWARAQYRLALEALKAEQAPWDWVQAQRALGEALRRLPTGDRIDNLRQASAALEAALSGMPTDATEAERQPVKAALAEVLGELKSL